MQEKTARLDSNAGRVRLKLNPHKCTWMKVNSRNNKGLRVRDTVVEEVDSFTYLGGANDEGRKRNNGHQEEDSIGVCQLQQVQQDLGEQETSAGGQRQRSSRRQ